MTNHDASAQVAARLRASGFALPGPLTGFAAEAIHDWGAALELLRRSWQQVAEKSRSSARRALAETQLQVITLCERQWRESHSDAVSANVAPVAAAWLGQRRWWSSGPMPAGRRVAIVSSRLPRMLDADGAWLDGLRTALNRVRERGEVLVVGHGTAGSELILRGALQREIPTLLVRGCSSLEGEAWAPLAKESLHQPRPEGRSELWALPSWDSMEDTTAPAALLSIPERDRAAIALADEVLVLGLRAKGNIQKLLVEKLAGQLDSVGLVDMQALQAKGARKDLLARGATIWELPPAPPLETCEPPLCKAEEGFVSLAPVPAAEAWSFLTHTTRDSPGPWPGQSTDDYLDSLLEGRADADHSAFGTLFRILTERRLRASSQAIRGGSAVVCFTAVPLAELSRLRTFRSHRTRWDFEPFGICIRQSWLEQRGCRPVRYGDLELWRQLTESDKPFFQRLQSNSRTASTDWSAEQEWRCVGDVDLTELSPVDAVVIVPTLEMAYRLCHISAWPIKVLCEGGAESAPIDV